MSFAKETEEQMGDRAVFVEFPEDIVAKREATARHKGAFI